MAESDINNTRELLRGFGDVKSFSTRLIYNTNQVAIVDKRGVYIAGKLGSRIANYDLFEEFMQPHADAMLTDVPGTTLIGYAADCVLAHIEDPVNNVTGFFHASWRNALGFSENCTDGCSIMEATLQTMKKFYHTKPEDVVVELFPSISVQSLKLPRTVLETQVPAYLSECIVMGEYLDLTQVVIKTLSLLGVSEKKIHYVALTTDMALFQSKRLARQAMPCYQIGFFKDDYMKNIDVISSPAYERYPYPACNPQRFSGHTNWLYETIPANSANMLFVTKK